MSRLHKKRGSGLAGLSPLYQCDPVLVGGIGRTADDARAGAGYCGYDARLQRASRPRVVPLDGEGRRAVAQVEARYAAARIIYGVDFTRLGEAVIVRSSSQLVVMSHLGKGQMLAEEVQGVPGQIPEMVSAAPVFAIEIVVGPFIAEMPFDARAAGHEMAPEVFVPDVVMPVVVPVGLGAGMGRADLVERNEPLPSRRGRAVDPFYRLGVRVVGLQRGAVEITVSQQRFIRIVVLARVCVADDRMIVRVHVLYVSTEGLTLGGRVGVLFAEVPDQGEVMAEAGDEFAVVESSLRAEIAVVETLVVLGLLADDVEHQAELVHVREDDLPLIELAAVESESLARARPGPDILAVAAVDVVGDEIYAVHALGSEVIQRSDHAPAPAVLPARVAGSPVSYMRGVMVDELCAGGFAFTLQFAAVKGIVEVRVAKEVLGTIGSALEEVLTRAGELEIALADVFKQAFGPVVTPGLVTGCDLECSFQTVERHGRAGPRIAGECDVGPGAKGCGVRPSPRFVRHKMHAPFTTRLDAGLRSVTICGIIPGDDVSLPAFGEGYGKTVIPEGIRLSVFAGVGPGERQRDIVPFFQLAGDLTFPVRTKGARFGCKYQTNGNRQNKSEPRHFSTPKKVNEWVISGHVTGRAQTFATSFSSLRFHGIVRDVAVLIAIGAQKDGKRAVPGLSVALSEAEVHWLTGKRYLNMNTGMND